MRTSQPPPFRRAAEHRSRPAEMAENRPIQANAIAETPGFVEVEMAKFGRVYSYTRAPAYSSRAESHLTRLSAPAAWRGVV
jgi:hypothetical protein